VTVPSSLGFRASSLRLPVLLLGLGLRQGLPRAGGVSSGYGCSGVLPMAGGEVPDGGGGRGGGGARRDRGRQGARRHLQAQPQQPRVRQPLPRYERNHTPLLPPGGQGKYDFFLPPPSLLLVGLLQALFGTPKANS
jgi:hypothetical protein